MSDEKNLREMIKKALVTLFVVLIIGIFLLVGLNMIYDSLDTRGQGRFIGIMDATSYIAVGIIAYWLGGRSKGKMFNTLIISLADFVGSVKHGSTNYRYDQRNNSEYNAHPPPPPIVRQPVIPQLPPITRQSLGDTDNIEPGEYSEIVM